MQNITFKQWLIESDEKKAKIRNLVDGENLILFFTKDSNIFGAPEESRLVFAKLKNPNDEELPNGWVDEANFAAFDLIKALVGEKVQNLFSKKDLPAIKILDPEKVEDMLLKTKMPVKPSHNLKITHDKHGADMLNLKDRG